MDLTQQALGFGYLPDEIGAMNNLKTLILAYGGISLLPSNFCNLTKLTHLDLSGNNLGILVNGADPRNTTRCFTTLELQVLNVSSSMRTYFLDQTSFRIEDVPNIVILNASHILDVIAETEWVIPRMLAKWRNLEILDSLYTTWINYTSSFTMPSVWNTRSDLHCSNFPTSWSQAPQSQRLVNLTGLNKFVKQKSEPFSPEGYMMFDSLARFDAVGFNCTFPSQVEQICSR